MESGVPVATTLFKEPGISGESIRKRKQFPKLLEAVRNRQVDFVVAHRYDRISRNMEDYFSIKRLLRENGVELLLVDGAVDEASPHGKAMARMQMVWAEMDRDLASVRITDKVEAAKAHGLYTGGPPVLGYRVDEYKRLQIVEEESIIVRFIFEEYAVHGSVVRILEGLAERGYGPKSWTLKSGEVKTRKPWTKNQIYRILDNKLYVGVVTHKRLEAEYPGKHSAIISKDLWIRAAARLELQTTKRSRNRSTCKGGSGAKSAAEHASGR